MLGEKGNLTTISSFTMLNMDRLNCNVSSHQFIGLNLLEHSQFGPTISTSICNSKKELC